jgi:hypothetical protein
MIDDEPTEIAPPTQTDRELISDALRAVTRLVAHKLGAELGPDFAKAFAAGRAQLLVEIELPSGSLTCDAVWPEMDTERQRVFEIRITAPAALN